MNGLSVRNVPEFHVEWYEPDTRRAKKNLRILDACHFTRSGIYEIMVMDGYGKEIASLRTEDREEMERFYIDYILKYAPSSWHKVIDDLKKAKELAQAVEGDDDGTCNFDNPAILPPKGMDIEQLIACCVAADVTFIDRKKGNETCLLIGAHGIGQGSRRTRGAIAAKEYLRSQGYTAGMYYQMD